MIAACSGIYFSCASCAKSDVPHAVHLPRPTHQSNMLRLAALVVLGLRQGEFTALMVRILPVFIDRHAKRSFDKCRAPYLRQYLRDPRLRIPLPPEFIYRRKREWVVGSAPDCADLQVVYGDRRRALPRASCAFVTVVRAYLYSTLHPVPKRTDRRIRNATVAPRTERSTRRSDMDSEMLSYELYPTIALGYVDLIVR